MVSEPQRSVTIDEYERMIKAGILGPDDRVELFEGRLVAKAPMGDRHAIGIVRSNRGA